MLITQNVVSGNMLQAQSVLAWMYKPLQLVSFWLVAITACDSRCKMLTL